MRRFAVALGVVLVLLAVAPAAQARTLHYWIAAVPTTWNIMPSQHDPITGVTFRPEDTTFQTVVYKRFTRNWGRMMRNLPAVTGDNDGIPGPTIRARVGDTVLVHFKNMDTLMNDPHSMHFHAFLYPFPSDGAYIPGASGRGANVRPGRSFTYRLKAIRNSTGAWPYHDHSPSMHHAIPGGMYGMVIVYGRREKRADRENIVQFGQHLGFRTINGRAFIRNTPTFKARLGHRVSWNVMGIGSEHHTFHLHGHRWRHAGENIDVRTVGPAESFRFTIREDVPGTWFYHCHVETHMATGMQGLYQVSRLRARRAGGTAAAIAGR
jgi:FtsP/CotA-like multicopper oxidase with cupredoxin domain